MASCNRCGTPDLAWAQSARTQKYYLAVGRGSRTPHFCPAEGQSPAPAQPQPARPARRSAPTQGLDVLTNPALVNPAPTPPQVSDPLGTLLIALAKDLASDAPSDLPILRAKAQVIVALLGPAAAA